jgi:hypothetical protein
MFHATVAVAETAYLQNDSYDGEGVICVLNVGDQDAFAAKFTASPDMYPYTIASIRVLTCGTALAAFAIDIWQDDGNNVNPPGNPLWSSANVYVIGGNGVFFNDIVLSSEPIPPPEITSGTIRVSLFSVIPAPGFGIGVDLNGIVPLRNLFKTEIGTWSFIENPPLNQVGDWIMRLGIETEPTGVDDARGYALMQNVPNPFNPATVIRYQVPVPGTMVNLAVYGADGRWIRTLIDGQHPGGAGSVEWDGTDSNGNRVASGVYFYRLRSEGFDQTKKMVLIK